MQDAYVPQVFLCRDYVLLKALLQSLHRAPILVVKHRHEAELRPEQQQCVGFMEVLLALLLIAVEEELFMDAFSFLLSQALA